MAGMFDSVMKMFSPQGGATTTGTNAPMPGNPTQVANPGQPLPGVNANNPTVPDPNSGKPFPAPGSQDSTGTAQNQNQTEENPLDKFKDLWTPPKDAPTPASVKDIFAKLDMKKLAETASSMDFSKVVTPEDMQKIQAGGADAMQTMLTLMNKMSQQAYTQSTLASVKMLEQAMGRAEQIGDARLPALVRSSASSDLIRQEDAMYNHPTMQPMVEALKTQFLNRNPNATPAEIKTQVVDALSAFGKALNPNKPNASNTGASGASKDMDWDAWLAA